MKLFNIKFACGLVRDLFRVPVLLFLSGIVLSRSLNAAQIFVLGTSGISPQLMVTNSVFSDVSIENGILISYSPTDSHITCNPFVDDWNAVQNGTLHCDLTVVSDVTNSVSVLFGSCNDPALSVFCADDWQIMPAGVFPRRMRTIGGSNLSTNRIEFVLRIPNEKTQGKLHAKASVNLGVLSAREDLALTSLNWRYPSQLPENWQTVTFQLAGDNARVLDCKMKYRPDESVLMFR